MDALALLREQITVAHGYVDLTLGEITSAQANWRPGGRAHSIGATYAHLAISEDWIINGLIKGGAPLCMSSYAGRIGVSELPPTDNVSVWDAWAARMTVEIATLRAYSAAVYAATDAYLAGLSVDDLTGAIDLAFIGIGARSLAWTLSVVILSHSGTHTGEIACVKWLQGLQGYPG